MKTIELTQGKLALVDDADYEWLNQFKWYADRDSRGGDFYAVRNSPMVNGKRHLISMARQILGLERGDKREADHEDCNTLDNQRDNLRICTRHQNTMSRSPNQKPTTSQYKGVHWFKSTKRWYACIKVSGKQIYLGYYDDEVTAAMAYDLVARKAFGVFAYLNFPQQNC